MGAWLMIPVKALLYLPLLAVEINAYWPELHNRAILAGQIEQETCITLRHDKCWNPRTELKTSREYGFGFGQITITDRFNVFDELRQDHESLHGWLWHDRYNPQYQLRALVLKDRSEWSAMHFAANNYERTAFMLSAYNGGRSGVFKDRRLCAAKQGCDPDRWFGHVELESFRSKVAVKGYGQSFYSINRDYVRSIVHTRSKRYIGLI